MNLELQGKVALVTGGAKGIGGAITRGFAKEGASVAIVDRNPNVADALIKEIRAASSDGDLFCIPTELTDLDACRAAVEQTAERAGRLDYLVHNAGSNDGAGLDSPPEAFLDSLRKNLLHVHALTHHALPHLAESCGAIVNVGSKVAETGQGGTSGYAAAKGAMNALTREWALDLAERGIRVNAVIPAEVMTPMYRRWLDTLQDPEATLRSIETNVPLGQRMTTDREIADAVLFLASPRSSHTTGQIFHPDGGYRHLDRAYGKIQTD